MTDDLRALIADAYTRRADSVEAMRRENNPFMPEYQRPERKTKPAHRDYTGSRATGKARKDDPDGAIARARAARRALLEERQR
ncbi:hypothetical protein [Brachybacterium sp. GU-2]|uniref:hypothetical protein n=1 Tax=Brachybacterium sp. GU-2 TaxID=3069708 RepID=UPI00280A8B1B|nr:hypothetical protein [Brachybacterium sp. GU-2]WME22105.1 hypothetical protein RBL05_11225 [Brachybacterium sp. GU-2]